ncbi:MAG: superoxide dismutase family protein [Verrucomicrobiota bacterium]
MNRPISKPLSLIILSLVIASITALADDNRDRPGPQSIPRYTKSKTFSLSDLFKSPSDKDEETADSTDESAADPSHLLIAVIQPTEAQSTKGVIYFETVEEGIQVSGSLSELAPGEYDICVHQYGDLSAVDGSSAGEPFNPDSQSKVSEKNSNSYFGHLGRVSVDEDGVAEFSFVDSGFSLAGPNSILGRSLLVFGDTGVPPVGMAVIGIASRSAN